MRRSAICVALLGAAVVLALPTVSRADLILAGGADANTPGTPEQAFTQLGAQGFGNAPRLLTLQGNDPEKGQLLFTGGTASADTFTGATTDAGVGNSLLPGARNDIPPPACCDANKASAPSLGAIAWDSAADVAIGFNAGQTGISGIHLDNLVLMLWDSAGTLLGKFALAPTTGVQFSNDDLRLQEGNGNAVFKFVLNTAQQAIFQGLLTGDFSAFHITLAAALSGANDGPDSFVAVLGEGAPVPLPPAVLLFGTALVGMGVLARRRKKGLAQAI